MLSLSSPVQSSRFIPNFMSVCPWLYFGQLETGAARTVEKLVGFVIVDELLGRWIPFQFAIELTRDVNQMTNANGAVANFDVGVGALARLDTVEPVLDVR